jgi:hypothetical protein
MAKRVSLKGKGADIFFGDYQPTASPGSESADRADAVPAGAAAKATEPPPRKRAAKSTVSPATQSLTADHPEVIDTGAVPGEAPPSAGTPLPLPSKPARHTASQNARLQARKQASMGDSSTTAALQIPEGLEGLDVVLDSVSEAATITNSFRYTEQELSWLTDALYEIGKRYSCKLSKQDVARLGLNLVLWDYRARGDASVLGTLAQRRRRRR